MGRQLKLEYKEESTLPLGVEGGVGARTALCGGRLTEAGTKVELNPTSDVRKVKGWIYQEKKANDKWEN